MNYSVFLHVRIPDIAQEKNMKKTKMIFWNDFDIYFSKSLWIRKYEYGINLQPK